MLSHSSKIYFKFLLLISNSFERFYILHKVNKRVKTQLSIFLFVYSKNVKEIKDLVVSYLNLVNFNYNDYD